MIKNVVFDFGQVLVRFEPAYMVGQYVTQPEDAALLEKVVFDILYWDRLDAGTITDEAVMEAVKTRLPERLWSVAKTIYYNWIYNIPEIEGMRDLILYIKDKYGASVFVLSNISVYFADHSGEIPILDLVDGCIFSSKCGRVKPERDIYEYLCSHFDIIPEETVFVDDRADNIEGARSVGIDGYLFDGNAAKLKNYLDEKFPKNV